MNDDSQHTNEPPGVIDIRRARRAKRGGAGSPSDVAAMRAEYRVQSLGPRETGGIYAVFLCNDGALALRAVVLWALVAERLLEGRHLGRTVQLDGETRKVMNWEHVQTNEGLVQGLVRDYDGMVCAGGGLLDPTSTDRHWFILYWHPQDVVGLRVRLHEEHALAEWRAGGPDLTPEQRILFNQSLEAIEKRYPRKRN